MGNSKFSERLQYLMNVNGYTQMKISKDLNINRHMLWRYLNKDVSPNSTRLDEFAKYFNVTTDFLLGKDMNDTTLKIAVDNIFDKKDIIKAIKEKRVAILTEWAKSKLSSKSVKAVEEYVMYLIDTENQNGKQ